MEWFYEKEGKQNGPVEAEDLTRMLEAGELSLKSLVWREGLADWKPMEEAGIMTGDLGEDMGVCAYSGKVRPKSEMVPYGESWVLPEHRDDFVQRLMEGAREEGGGEIADYEPNISRHLNQAWALLSSDFWPIIGVSAAVFLGYMAVSQVPILGMFAAFVSTPIFAGLFYYLLRKVRGQAPLFEVCLSGFKRNFLQLLFLGLIQMVLTWVSMIPGALVLTGGIVAIEGISEVAGVTIVVLGGIIAFLPSVYISTIWMFSTWLCIDQELDFWPAMTKSMQAVNKHWFSCFLFMLVIGLINMAGMVVFCLGLFVTFPLTMLALAYFYEDVFGGQRVRQLTMEAE